MKKVFVYAYLQFNLGDDLFIKSLIEKYPNTIFYVIADLKYRKAFRKNRNLKIISNCKSKIKLLDVIKGRVIHHIKRKCKIVIFIGGSIFMEYPEWRNILNWYREMSRDKRSYILGANFGPFYHEDYYLECKKFFSTINNICFRDKWSYSLFRSSPNIRYAPDILFSLDVSEYTNCITEKKAVISIIDCESRNDYPNRLSEHSENYMNCLYRIIEILIYNKFRITILSFCKKEHDDKAAIDIMRKLDEGDLHNISNISYDGTNIDDILEEIASSEYVIGTRFHSIVLSFLLKKPILPIIYNIKTEHLLEDVDFVGNVIDINKLNDISLDNDFIMSNYLNQRILNTDKIIKDSKTHFFNLNKELE